jgi:hypothetical protein
MTTDANMRSSLTALLDVLREEKGCLDRQDIDGLEAASAKKLLLLENLKTTAVANTRVNNDLAQDLRDACRDIEMRLHVMADMTQRRLATLMGLCGDTQTPTYNARGSVTHHTGMKATLRG